MTLNVSGAFFYSNSGMQSFLNNSLIWIKVVQTVSMRLDLVHRIFTFASLLIISRDGTVHFVSFHTGEIAFGIIPPLFNSLLSKVLFCRALLTVAKWTIPGQPWDPKFRLQTDLSFTIEPPWSSQCIIIMLMD